MSTTPHLSSATNENEVSPFLRGLAPFPLPYKRTTRYMGDDLCAGFNEFQPTDQDTILRLYKFLILFLDRLAPYPVDEEKWVAIDEIAATTQVDDLLGSVQQLGVAASEAGSLHGPAARAIHDLRGGALTSILSRLQVIAYTQSQHAQNPHPPGELNQLFILARDHLKITRNAIVGLDDEKRDRDRASKLHHIHMLADKWQNVIPGSATRGKKVEVDTRYHGNMSECCLESAAIDRIFYNLMNNACRHCVGPGVKVDIFLVPGEPHGHIRFVVSNEINEEQAVRLRKMGREELNGIFDAGVSTTGSGLGLAIVAEFVAHAFGLAGKREALEGGYLGTVIEDQRFYAWFHWPAAREGQPSSENAL